jgi:lysophospholipase L1-like esterase
VVARRAQTVVLALAFLLVGCRASESHRLPADRQAPVLYVALGDSTVEGVGATAPDRTYVAVLHDHLRQRYPAARVENLGVGGATSADVLAGQVPRAVTLQPQLVTLSVGPNDITGRQLVHQFERNVDKILGGLRATGAVVVVNLLPDLAVTPRFRGSPAQESVGRLTVQFNEALRRTSREHGAEVVDLYRPSQVEVLARPELVAGDGYHPSDAGYTRWAELMWQGIERRMPR